eukprot:COSAG01_NODE_55095_length_327_cov_1.122807_1_plen_100_part_10
MWLRKDTCNTVDNALTLASCSPAALVYNGQRNISADASGALRFYNASATGSYLCMQLRRPSGGPHVAMPTLSATDAWLTARPCEASGSSRKWTLDAKGQL